MKFLNRLRKKKGSAKPRSGDSELDAMVDRIRRKKPGLTDRQYRALAKAALARGQQTDLAAAPGRYAIVDLATGQTIQVIELTSTPPVERAGSRRKLAGQGEALPDGSFPVPDVAHLRKALQAVGRADPAKRPALARLIYRRAKTLGALDVLKGTWVERELGGGKQAA